MYRGQTHGIFTFTEVYSAESLTSTTAEHMDQKATISPKINTSPGNNSLGKADVYSEHGVLSNTCTIGKQLENSAASFSDKMASNSIWLCIRIQLL